MEYTLKSPHKTKSNFGSYCLLSTFAMCLQTVSYTIDIKAVLETGKMAQRVEVIACQAWRPEFNSQDWKQGQKSGTGTVRQDTVLTVS